jgi:hypothetical protein
VLAAARSPGIAAEGLKLTAAPAGVQRWLNNNQIADLMLGLGAYTLGASLVGGRLAVGAANEPGDDEQRAHSAVCPSNTGPATRAAASKVITAAMTLNTTAHQLLDPAPSSQRPFMSYPTGRTNPVSPAAGAIDGADLCHGLRDPA